ncbi:MAG: hypothetical protein ACYTFY_16000 [Planctomycetota bacterium]|jgi:hypothetical protein
MKHCKFTTQVFFALAAAVILFSAGCTRKIVNYAANTELADDGTALRVVSITLHTPGKITEVKKPVSNYLALPNAENYSIYKVTPERVKFSGRFKSIEEMPVDFMKKTPGINFWAQNHITFTRRDCVLLTAYDYEEKITDIVEQAEVEESLKQAVNLLLEAVVSTLKKEYGSDYDFKEFSEYLREVLPPLTQRLYHIYWESRRADRQGSAGKINHVRELDHRIRKEISHYGIALESFRQKKGRKNNEKMAWSFLDSKLRKMVKPRKADLPPLTAKILQGKENQIKLLFSMLQEIQKSFGSVETFMHQLEIPLIAGAFSGITVPFTFKGNNLQFAEAEPDFNFFFRTRVPGKIVQTNGIRDIDGSLLWKFRGDDAMFTGYRMWAKTLTVDHDAAEKLGLTGFPGNIAAVERFYAIMTANGEINKDLLKLLSEAVEKESLDIIEEKKPAFSEVSYSAGKSSQAADKAGQLYDFLNAYRKKSSAAVSANAGKSSDERRSVQKSGRANTMISRERTEKKKAGVNVPSGPELD